MSRTSFLVAALFGAIIAVGLRETPARVSPRTMRAAELYQVFGGQIQDYCCANNSMCLASGQSCGQKSGTDQTTCSGFREVTVFAGNRNSCAMFSNGATCNQGTTYVCTNIYPCIWVQNGQVCQAGSLQSSFSAPSNCSDNCGG